MGKKLKIGIITHHYIKNYGAFLQAFALQETIKQIDPNADVEIINYINMKHYYSKLRPLLISKPQSKNLFIEFKISIENKKKILQYYKAKKYLNISARCHTSEDVNKRDYDVIFIGSDEVWDIYSVGCDKIKFAIGLHCSNVVSYAPSVGKFKANQELPRFVSEGIKNFKKVSVRDIQTRDMITPFYSGNIESVLDPTFLYDFHKIIKSMKGPIYPPYILIYQCELDAEQINLLKEFTKREGLTIIGAGHYKDWFDKSIINISPFEWVKLFSQSSYVVTGTFHGVIFAIKSKVKFIAYPTLPNRIEKIKSLFDILDLRKNLLDKENKCKICDYMIQNVDYINVYKIIQMHKHKSINYIKNCIVDSRWEDN
jgi:hypothetical protein